MGEVVIVDSVRTPIGRCSGSLARVHANELLGVRTGTGTIIERLTP